ncbi:MAG TPA: DMT family transporter [Bryobacteraceae bacterium]|nr:DMT family transporter [Bryobacteraceae bacterium]
MKHRFYVLAAALLFSTGGAAIKSTTLTSWQVASLRSLVAAVVLLAVLPEARRLGSARVWVASVAYAATLILFVLATKLTTAANAIFLQATAPFYLLAIGPLVLKEPNTRRDYLLGAVMAAGMALFFLDAPGASALAPDPALGNALAAATGCTWALTVTALRSLGKEPGSSSLPVVSAGNLLAFAAALPFAWPITAPPATDVAALLYLGCFQIGLAYFCMTRGVRQVPAFEASVLILLEPAMNPVWTFLVHGERPGALSLAGGAVILGATLAHTALRPPTATLPQTPQSLPD